MKLHTCLLHSWIINGQKVDSDWNVCTDFLIHSSLQSLHFPRLHRGCVQLYAAPLTSQFPASFHNQHALTFRKIEFISKSFNRSYQSSYQEVVLYPNIASAKAVIKCWPLKKDNKHAIKSVWALFNPINPTVSYLIRKFLRALNYKHDQNLKKKKVIYNLVHAFCYLIYRL